MTWVPANITVPEHCFQNFLVSTCQPAFLTFLAIIIQYVGHSVDDKYRNLRNENENRFDFIIVGAGSAGCVVANRLSEVGNWKILLLEAGDEQPLVSDAPGLMSVLMGSSIDYDYKVAGITASTCKDRPNACRVARGKTMGGSSAINYMLYVRGSRHDYDGWAEAGNIGWNWKDVLPYFKKSENMSQLVPKGNPDDHGTDGTLGIEIPNMTPEGQVFLDSWKELGYNEIDYNSGDQIGASRFQFTIKNGIRQSTNEAFIRPIRGKRSNLTVRTNSQVTKIIINPMTRKAIGVEYIYNGVSKTVYAKKEVILSAGSFASPKLLMLSGIGPAKDLRKVGIKVIKDLPVGRNLQDHVSAPGLEILLNYTSTTLFDPLQDKVSDVKQWQKSRDGALKDAGMFNIVAFIPSSIENRTGYADIQIQVIPNFHDLDKNGIQSEYFGFPYFNRLVISPFLISPKSRGWVKLNKSDPIGSLPEVNFNFFDHPDDLKMYIDGAKKIYRLVETEAFKKHGFKYIKPPTPKCEQYINNNEKLFECMAKEYYFDAYHPVGTCKMGPNTDPEAVVDPRLRVRGIKRLRVIDASIIPESLRGNTNAAAIMIGEKGSDIIKEDWF